MLLLFQFGQAFLQLGLLAEHEHVAFSHFVQNEQLRHQCGQSRTDQKAAQPLQETGTATARFRRNNGGGIGRKGSQLQLRKRRWLCGSY